MTETYKPGEKRPKKRGEHWPVLLVADLPSDTLHKFRGEVMNKANQKDRVGERTVDSYERNIRRFLEYLEEYRNKTPLEAETSDLRQFLRHCRRQGDKDNTIKTRRSAVSRFYSELEVMATDDVIDLDADDVPENPEEGYDATWNVDETHKQQESGGNDGIAWLKPEEMKQLWNNVPAPTLRNKLIVKLLYHTAMRVSELTHVKLSHIGFPWDGEKREIDVPAVSSKSGSRTVAYKATLDDDLRRWVQGGFRDAEHYAAESDFLFPTSQSERISRETVRTVIRQAADNAGLDNDTIYTDKAGNERTRISPHICRHSMAVNTLDAGRMNVRELQEYLGHHSLDVTERYLEITSDGATDKYHEMDGVPEGD